MGETNIMDIDVNNLQQKQYEYLLNHAIKILDEIKDDLKNGRLQNVLDRLKFSPAGDCMVFDNYFINFSYRKNERMDLADILNKMANLSNYDLDWGEY